jgi:V8-like Glu-specific endopeptidase
MNVVRSRRTGVVRAATVAAVYAITLIGQPVVFAQSGGGRPPALNTGNSRSDANATQTQAEAYWTPQRLLTAKPIESHPRFGVRRAVDATQTVHDNSPSVRGEGAAPTVALPPHNSKVLIPEAYLEPDALAIARGRLGAAQPTVDVEPNATSSYGARFTTSRVFPDAAVSAYPNRTAGKLFFSDPFLGGDYNCSASVLQRRLVVTAGHCVSSPSTVASERYFFTNFMFVPAYRNGVAPFGTWTPSAVWVTNAWHLSDGSVPNAQDVAIMVMNDNGVTPIGAVTGYLGYLTNALANNSVTMLGYPLNLDSGERMQINTAQTFKFGGNNTYQYGSAMRGGSSGGPWIQDWGVNPSSNPVVVLGRNYLVSVTSYGPTATEPKYQGASNLDSRFLSLRTAACGAAGSGNCQ